MKKVETGNFVKVHYTGTLEDGRVFDSSQQREPMEVQVGNGIVIKGFEEALIGMAVNEKKTFTLQPEEAYGLRQEGREQSFLRADLPQGFEPEVGQVVALQNDMGQQVPAKVTHADNEKVVVDLNHPMAGIPLTFEVEVIEINDQASPSTCDSSGCGGCCGSCH